MAFIRRKTLDLSFKILDREHNFVTLEEQRFY